MYREKMGLLRICTQTLCIRVVTSLSLIVGTTVLQPVFAASFDCSKARTDIEEKMCGDQTISHLDEKVAATYEAIKSNIDLFPFLRRSQTAWLSERTTENLLEQYRSRLRVLQELQPSYSCLINGKNWEALDSCLRLSTDKVEECIAALSSTTVAMVTCTGEAIRTWEILLEYSLTKAKARAKNDLIFVQSIEKAHASWLAFKRDECQMEYTKYREGTISGPISAGCKLRFIMNRVKTYSLMSKDNY